MKRKQLFGAGFAVLALAASVTSADAVLVSGYTYGNYGSVASSIFSATVGYVNGIQDNTRVAQGFSVGDTSWDIEEIECGLAYFDSTAPSAKAYLYSETSGAPGSQLAEFALSGSSLSNSKQTISFTGSYTVQPSTNYWIVLGAEDAVSNHASFEWYLEDTGATPSERNASGMGYIGTKVQNFSGASWTDTLSGLSLRVTASAVPEPSTYALAMVAGVLSVTARRRTKTA